jgi:hypothetical protein
MDDFPIASQPLLTRRKHMPHIDQPDAIRRQFARLLSVGCASALLPLLAYAQTGAMLPTPESLAESLASALRAGQPLVVMVSLEGCPFCKVARNSYLAPLYRQGLPIVQIDMRTNAAVQDFQAVPTTHDALVRKWNIKVAPTVLFFGPDGKEVAERLRGASIPDYYGAYLDQRLVTARAALQR